MRRDGWGKVLADRRIKDGGSDASVLFLARAIPIIGLTTRAIGVMNKSEAQQLCPVCGFALDFVPWCEGSAADEICPCCGIQFGYADAAGGNIIKRQEVYEKWRRLWIDAGYAMES
jgi:hypothetical protein